MTQDEIIELAKQAQLMDEESHASPWVEGHEILQYIEAFTKLVEDKTKKELREEIVYKWVPPHFVNLAVEAEREACAEIGDGFHDENANCGDLIRARGKA